MTKMPEQIQGFNKEAVEAALSFAQLSMAGAERLMHLQIDAAKTFVAEQTESAKALAEAKDPASMMALRARLTEQAVERAVGYSRNVYEVATQTQQQLAKLVEGQLAASQQQFAGAMENMFKAAPGGSNAAIDAVRSTMAATQSAMDSMTKAAKQAADLAEANVKAVTDAATSAMKGPKKK